MLIAIEGIDGSGKGTQTAALERRALTAGVRTRAFSFPRYGTNPFADAVGAYLNGAFGRADEVSPYLSALLYAGDRFTAKEELLHAIRSVELVVSDRYVDSNIAHQAAKLPGDERLRFIRWIEDIEYGTYAMPRADLTVFLSVPVETAVDLIAKKSPRAYTQRAADIHEADPAYLEACAEVYTFLARRNPSASVIINCVDSSGVRSPERISEDIWSHIAGNLRGRLEQRP
jgi:dTMP kinase